MLRVLVLTTALLAACGSHQEPATVSAQRAMPTPQPGGGTPWTWDLPRGFPQPRVPATNPMTAEKVALGRALFYDPRLSGPGTFSCATCHRPELAFTDGRGQALGVTGMRHPRGAMSLANVAYSATLTWADATLIALEEQALVPMMNEAPVEMGVRGREAEVLTRFSANADDRARFDSAFPGDPNPWRFERIVQALAVFERTLISGNSAYDRYVYRDDQAALSASARRGMTLFFSERLGCSFCHGGFTFSGPTIWQGSPNVETVFHNTGLYNLRDAKGRPGAYPLDNPGLLAHTGRKRDMGRFRAPTLRNIAVTAPYMHDGSIASLEEVLEHYARGGRTSSPRKSPRLHGFSLSEAEKADVIAFLHGLTDESFLDDPRFAAPTRPR